MHNPRCQQPDEIRRCVWFRIVERGRGPGTCISTSAAARKKQHEAGITQQLLQLWSSITSMQDDTDKNHHLLMGIVTHWSVGHLSTSVLSHTSLYTSDGERKTYTWSNSRGFDHKIKSNHSLKSHLKLHLDYCTLHRWSSKVTTHS